MVAVPRPEEPFPDFRNPAAVAEYMQNHWNRDPDKPLGLRPKVTYFQPGPPGLGGAIYRISITGEGYGGPREAFVFVSAHDQENPYRATRQFTSARFDLLSEMTRTLLRKFRENDASDINSAGMN